MSDDAQEKTQDATPRKRKESADKGEVPRSQEVTTAFLLVAAAGAMATVSGTLAGTVVELFSGSVRSVTNLPVGPEAVAAHISGLGWKMLAGMAPLLVIMSGTALAVSAVQARGILTLKPLEPQWNRLNPLTKAKQIWGTKAIAELLKSFLKLAVISLAVYLAVAPVMGDASALSQTGPYALLMLIRRVAVRTLLSAGLVYLTIALGDYAFQVWQHEKQLKMSREEIKKEFKESEGDQVVKVRRRTMAQGFARRRMLLSVSEADVVVTNPTHIAVALKYDPSQSHAPIVLAMGERKVAEAIKEKAREAGVPMIENKPLARTLLATAQVGMAIPVELFVAVAEVLAWAYRSRGAGAPGYGQPRSYRV